MLDGLHDIEWDSLEHAQGSAADVPGLLQQLVSEDGDEQAEALEELSYTIWDMGEVYSATAPAVPFLYEALQLEQMEMKENLATLLAGIACVAGSTSAADPEHEGVLKAVHQASSAGLQQLQPYLQAYEMELRELVASALGDYPEHAAWSLPAIEQALQTETSESIRDTLLSSKEKLS